MKLKLSDWASIAEIGSGIAVFVTLIFLLIGLRENTEITRFSVYAGLIDMQEEYERDIFKDPELSRIFSASVSRNTQDLDDVDKRRLGQMIPARFRMYEKAYYARRYDVIGDAEWRRFERAICSGYRNAQSFDETTGTDTIELGLNAVLTEEFLNYIAESCAD